MVWRLLFFLCLLGFWLICHLVDCSECLTIDHWFVGGHCAHLGFLVELFLHFGLDFAYIEVGGTVLVADVGEAGLVYILWNMFAQTLNRSLRPQILSKFTIPRFLKSPTQKIQTPMTSMSPLLNLTHKRRLLTIDSLKLFSKNPLRIFKSSLGKLMITHLKK